MAELKITAIIPVDPDDAPARKPKKAASATVRKAQPRNATSSHSQASSRSDDEEIVDPSEPEFDPKAVEDEVKRRYGLETPLKVTEVKRSRSGVKAHRTGATRR